MTPVSDGAVLYQVPGISYCLLVEIDCIAQHTKRTPAAAVKFYHAQLNPQQPMEPWRILMALEQLEPVEPLAIVGAMCFLPALLSQAV